VQKTISLFNQSDANVHFSFLRGCFFPPHRSAADKNAHRLFPANAHHDENCPTTAWGAAAVGPRDIHNGLEDTTIKQLVLLGRGTK